jgi:hypothetical protein
MIDHLKKTVIQMFVLAQLLIVMSCHDNTGHQIVFHPPGINGNVIGDVTFQFLISAIDGNKSLEKRVEKALLHYQLGASTTQDIPPTLISLNNKELMLAFEIKGSAISALSANCKGDLKYYLTYTMDGNDESLSSRENPKVLTWSK